MKKIKSILALLLLGGLIVTGCDKKQSNTGGSQPNNSSSQSGSGDNGGQQGGGDNGGQQGGGGQTVTATWPATTVQVYLDILGVEHDRVPAIENDAITSYAVSPDQATAQTEKAFSISCMGGGALLNSYVDTLTANGYTYREQAGCYMTPLGEVCIGLDAVDGNLVIIVMLPDAGGQGGGGGGGSIIPDDSRFLNKKIATTSVSTNPTVAAAEAMFANSYVAFFDDGTCELVIEVANNPYYVLFGTYSVNPSDNLATIHSYKLYDAENNEYTWGVDSELQTILVNYLADSDTFETTIEISGSLPIDPTAATLTMSALPNPPMRANLPDDPNGSGITFDERYQVQNSLWDYWFNDTTFRNTRRFTVSANVPGIMIDTYDYWVYEVDGRRIHYTLQDAPNNETYFLLEDPVYDGENNLEGYYVDVWQKSDDWTPHLNQEFLFDRLSSEWGLHGVSFMDMEYNPYQHYYYASRAYYMTSADTQDELNRFTVSFENNILKRISYQKSGYEYSYDFTSVGTTTVEFPDFDGGGGGGGSTDPAPTAAYLAARESFEDETGITVPLINDLDASYYANDDPVYYMFTTSVNAPTTIFDSFVSSFDTQLTSPEWNKGSLQDTEDYSRYIYTDTSGDEVYLEYYKAESYLSVSYYVSNGGGTPIVATPQLHYGSGINWYDEPMPAAGDNLAQLENFQLFENEEFVINMGNDNWIYYESYQHSPDTAGGMITEGEAGIGGHNFHVEETGTYSIYVNQYSLVYIVHETSGGGGGGDPEPTCSWPSTYIENALSVWNVTNDTMPACDMTGVTSVLTNPAESVQADDASFTIALIGGNKGDSYASALGSLGYTLQDLGGGMYAYLTANREIAIALHESEGNLSIIVLKFTAPSTDVPALYILRNSDSSEEYINLEYDDVKNELYYVDLYLYEDDEFAILLGGTDYLFYEAFVKSSPDTSNGCIVEGMDAESGYHAFKATEEGYYSIYINSSNEVYIVHGPQAPSEPFLMYGSDLEGWNYLELTQNGSQWEIEGEWFDENTEFVFKIYDTWYHHDKYIATDNDKGNIGASGENLLALADGYYSFYINMNEGGNIYVVYSAD